MADGRDYLRIGDARALRGIGWRQRHQTQVAMLDVAASPQVALMPLLARLEGALAGQPFVREWIGHAERIATQRPEEGHTAPGQLAQLVLVLWLQLCGTRAMVPVPGSMRPRGATRFELSSRIMEPTRQGPAYLQLAAKTVGRAVALVSQGADRAADAEFAAWFAEQRLRLTIGEVSANVAFLRLAAERRGIPWFSIGPEVDQFGWGTRARRMRSTFTDASGMTAHNIVKNKATANAVLAAAGFPVPVQALVDSEDACVAAAARIGFPVVVKPTSQDFGRGVDVGLRDEQAVRRAYQATQGMGQVAVERHVDGDEFRLTVVGYTLMSAYRRVAPMLAGDGRSSVRELLDAFNADPRRGVSPAGLRRIDASDEVIETLRRQGLALDDIPAPGRAVGLIRIPFISRGAVPEECLAQVHPDNRRLMERAARVVGLDIAGIDFIISDIRRSWREVGGAILEVNTQPRLTADRIANPEGDLYGRLIEWLMAGGDGRIPVAAVMGGERAANDGEGAATPALWQCVRRLLGAHLTSAGRTDAGRTDVGIATRWGGFIGDDAVTDSDASGAAARDVLLTDPAVGAAVIQIAPGDLARDGHPCDRYTVVALVDVRPDALDGLDVSTARQVFEDTAMRAATLVVNADDRLCRRVGQQLPADRLFMFSVSVTHEHLVAHLGVGGRAAFMEDGLVLATAADRERVLDRRECDASGVADADLLAAAAIASAMGMRPADLRRALGLAPTASPEDRAG